MHPYIVVREKKIERERKETRARKRSIPNTTKRARQKRKEKREESDARWTP
jgi:hypothetical protein